MNTIRFKAFVGSDGILKLDVPTDVRESELDVLVVMQPLETEAVDKNGWPIGFFERLDSIEADDMIERGEQLPFEVRDEIE